MRDTMFAAGGMFAFNATVAALLGLYREAALFSIATLAAILYLSWRQS